ncbi:unnamed protein product [marine sediment metagenome]|uniref:Uncharacterized protein n=1 Tax=marine sediment metagenome TaxID=412755 RepID=X1N4K3_9ZZZZ
MTVRENSVRGRVILRRDEAGKPNWSIEQTLKVCVKVDSEFENSGLLPAPRFREEVESNNLPYLMNWVQGCHFEWINPR